MLKEPLPSYHGIFPHPQDLKSARVFSLHFSVKLSHYFLLPCYYFRFCSGWKNPALQKVFWA